MLADEIVFLPFADAPGSVPIASQSFKIYAGEGTGSAERLETGYTAILNLLHHCADVIIH